MRFPDRDTMTENQVATNNAAGANLIRGRYYRFEPPVKATAIPTGGHGVCAAVVCTFERGYYINKIEGNHVFQGKPTNDTRKIPVPKGYEIVPNLDEIMERLRESYFHVLFTGGSVAVLDIEQSHS